MRKDGWEPYKFKIWYLIPLIIYDLVIFAVTGYSVYGTPNFLADIIGIFIFLILFSINYIVGIRRMFADLTLKLKRLYFDPFLYWFIGTTIVILIEFVFIPNLSELISIFIFMGYGLVFYIWGILIAYVDIRDISI